jgi:hypothetical protein
METRPFKEFKFGEAAAELEATRHPELLTRGFVDQGGVVDELLTGDRFLVLGSKGTGKSAIAEHIRLSTASAKTFVHIAKLRDCTYSDLKTIAKGEEQPLPTAWSWLLLASLFASFKRAGAHVERDTALAWFNAVFQETRVLSSPDNLDQLVKASRRKPLTQTLEAFQRVERNPRQPSHGQSSVAGPVPPKADYQTSDSILSSFVDQLGSALARFDSDTRHFLFLDDTDEVLRLGKEALYSLSALIAESARINQAFRAASVRAKIIILCRTELFERIPGPNNNKVRQGYSIELDWYTPQYENSPLWTVANQRARIQSGSADLDIVDAYFPRTVSRSSGNVRLLPKNPTSTRAYLLDHTRYTPRDFVMLLQYIQKHSQGSTVTAEHIAYGLQDYAIRYFKPELGDELFGYIDEKDLTIVMDVFAQMRDELFTIKDLQARIPQQVHEYLPRLLSDLFNSSCIGNWERQEGALLRTYRFKYPHSRLDPSRAMMIHPALALAFNAPALNDADLVQDTGDADRASPRGEVTEVRTADGCGFLKGSDGHIFHFSLHETIGNRGARICRGDCVLFTPTKHTIGKFDKYAHATNVRLIPKTRRVADTE